MRRFFSLTASAAILTHFLYVFRDLDYRLQQHMETEMRRLEVKDHILMLCTSISHKQNMC